APGIFSAGVAGSLHLRARGMESIPLFSRAAKRRSVRLRTFRGGETEANGTARFAMRVLRCALRARQAAAIARSGQWAGNAP
ncbi:MAG TPA: hypothetical protein VK459_17770, partial [Polyangiaceae bacterium]|nr:hypothetical protein [Polyangiaceae bacterium]